jgi:N-acetylglucosaminyldiphosphoundecaprenol N-acetyl-beta-D-mannosaminyltransferase
MKMTLDEPLNFCDLQFKGLSKSILLMSRPGLTFVITVNAALIKLAHQHPKFRTLVNENFSTFDGQIPYFLAKLKYKNACFEKISGSDFAYDLCDYARSEQLSVFLLGGQADSNAGAVAELRCRFGITVDGYSPPHRPYPFDSMHNQAILQRLEAFRPDILMVGFGAPKQEFWIADNHAALEALGIRIAVGCGGSFDFISGKVRRAPLSIQRAGLEGVYRLIQEPKLFRLKRLLISFWVFWYAFC